MDIGTAELVGLGIVLARLLVPFLIVRFPLPAIVACLVLDAVDQTVFQALAPDANLDRADEQGFLKARPQAPPTAQAIG